MGLLQKFILAVVPQKMAAAMEVESRKWMMQCPGGAEISVWERVRGEG